MKELFKGSSMGMILAGSGSFTVLFLLIVLGSILFSVFTGGNNSTSSGASGGAVCNVSGELNKEKWDLTIAKAGVLKDYGDTFIQVAEKQGVDPVLFLAISIHETAWGKSSAVLNQNNPGGLMGSNGLMTFSTLEEGIESMGVTLHALIIKDKLVTLEKLGNHYAPIGADNDPTNLNANWVPVVTDFTNQLGGLTMNCTETEGGNSTGEFIVPVDNPVLTSGFYERINPVTGSHEKHKGIDFGQPTGSPIKAAANGTVVASQFDGAPFSGYGMVIVIDHGNGSWTLYGHQSELIAKVGDVVKQGDVIGKIGSTGQSTGPHLHFEIRHSYLGDQIDPAPILGLKVKE